MKYIAISLCILLNASAAYCQNYVQMTLSKHCADDYLDDVRVNIRQRWLPPKGSESKVVVVRFSIDNHAQVSKVAIVTSSGVAAVDDKAVKTIQPAVVEAIRPGGPTSCANDIELTFDYPNPPTLEQRAQSEKALKIAAGLKAKGDGAGAEKVLNEALAKDPENAHILAALQSVNASSNSWAKRRRIYQMMRDVRPDNLSEQGKVSEAGEAAPSCPFCHTASAVIPVISHSPTSEEQIEIKKGKLLQTLPRKDEPLAPEWYCGKCRRIFPGRS